MNADTVMTDINKTLASIQTHMEIAERTDVHLFLQLTAVYAKAYCLKLRLMK